MGQGRTYNLLNNLTTGEVDSTVFARTDIARYISSLAIGENLTIIPQGGVEPRPGTRFVAFAKFADKDARALSFTVAEDFDYAIEFGEKYMRFFTLNGRIQETALNITNAVDNGSGAIRITVANHAYDAARQVWQVDASPLAFSDQTANFNDATDANYVVFPATEAVNDYAAFGFVRPFGKLVFDNANGTAGVGGTVAWEYWNGTQWVALSGVTDGTTGFTAAVSDGQEVTWTIPTDWEAQIINDKWGFYARARITGTYTTNPIYDQGFVRDNSVPINIDFVEGTIEANGDWIIDIIDENTFDLIGSTFTNAYTANGEASKIVERPTPYLESELFESQFVNFEGVLYIVSNNHETLSLLRNSDLDWEVSNVLFVDGPYFDEDDSGITITPSGTTGTITLTASASLFDALHVGALWRIQHTAVYGYVRIIAFASATSVTAEVLSALDGSGTPAAAWREGLYSNKRGHAGAITIFEQRLILDGGPARLQTVVGSSTRNILDMTPGVNDDDAFVFQIGSKQLSSIKYFAPTANNLMIGTLRQEYTMKGGNNNPVTPTNVVIRPETNYGSSSAQPIEADNTILFVQRSGRRVREFKFDFEREGMRADDLSILAEHMTESGLKELQFELEPFQRVLGVRNDGQIAVLTRIQEQNITAWIRWLTNDGDDIFESVATIPHPDGDRDQTWTIVQRNVGGVKRYVERFDDTIRQDSGLSNTFAPPANVFTNLGHLEGRIVSVNADGTVRPDETVTNGQITIEGPAATDVDVGLRYEPRFIPLAPEQNFQDGPTHGRPRRIIRVRVFVEDTVGLVINDEEIPFRAAGDPMDEAVPPFTGYKDIVQTKWVQGAGDSGIEIKQSDPLPWRVIAVVFTVEYGDQ